jgi:acylphosphatase
MTDAVERRRVLFSGRVQGVGFRYTTARIAQRFAVTGFVRNLPNGQVEVVVEGLANSSESFLRAVGEAMKGNIDGIESTTSPASGEFDGFNIKS